jgi:hypothetical protein
VAIITVDFGTAPDANRNGERAGALIAPPVPCAPAKPATIEAAARGVAAASGRSDARR